MLHQLTNSVLDKIITDTALTVKEQKNQLPLADIKAQINDNPQEKRGFKLALQNHTQPAIIAEIKKASPSSGLIRADFNPTAIAQAYHQGGASCLSVLTDKKYFQGDDAYLQQVRATVPLPILRKDFIIDPYQIYHSSLLGADCILLIMAALTSSQAQEFYELAKSLGMDVLVEVHNEQELHSALAFSPDMIGINNRNLKTLEVDLAVTETLASLIPDTISKNCLLVAESGLHKGIDLHRMAKAGAGAFLIGESFMRQADITQAISQLCADFKALN